MTRALIFVGALLAACSAQPDDSRSSASGRAALAATAALEARPVALAPLTPRVTTPAEVRAFDASEVPVWQNRGAIAQRWNHALTFDPARNRVLAFGGLDASSVQVTDTYQWDGTTWTSFSGGIGSYHVPVAVYDSARAVTVALVTDRSYGCGSISCSELVELGSSGGWVARCTGSSPCASGVPVSSYSGEVAAAYHASRSRTVFHAGGATYEWTGSNFLTINTPQAPPYRVGHAMAYDARRGVTVLFGGKSAGSTYYDDVWEYDGLTWTPRTLSPRPPARAYATLVFDSARGKMILFGTYPEVWEYDGNGWKSFGTGAPARDGHGAAFDSTRRRMVVFGGQGLGDTWEYSTYGSNCGSGAECDSAACVDGACCQVATCGTCQTCKGTSPGTCTTVTSAEDPDSCAGASMCDATGACKLDGAQGCTNGAQCASGNCVDGVCCDTACGAVCDACNLPGRVGVCSNTPAGGDGTPSCAPYACSGTSSACATTCSGPTQCAASAFCSAGACVPDRADGLPCTNGSQCVSGNCVDGVCCNSVCTGSCNACLASQGAVADGVCTVLPAGSPGSPSCAPYLCGGGTGCSASCVTAAQCTPGSQCISGQCVGKFGLGAACTTDAVCDTGHCASGVCCNDACSSACHACSAATKQSGFLDGICDVAKLGTNPGQRCLDTGVASCDTDGTCDAQGQCAYYAAGSLCGPSLCGGNAVAGYQSSRSACDGAGACVVSDEPCAGYACAATGGACLATCFSSGECDASHHCAAGQCVPRSYEGVACTSDEECLAGNCVDGVCCNARCAGQCEACDVTGSLGTCTPVAGPVHGARPACDPGTTGAPCTARKCDGDLRTSCGAFVGTDISCRDAACTEGVSLLAEVCDGHGACPAERHVNCTPYVCSGDACGAEPCSTDADCATEFRCSEGKCVARATTSCASDGVTQENPDGTTTRCAPYICSGIACLTDCTRTEQCVSGYVCAATSKTCEPKSTASDASGCSCRSAPTGTSGATWVVLGMLLVGVRRRGRSRSVRPGFGSP